MIVRKLSQCVTEPQWIVVVGGDGGGVFGQTHYVPKRLRSLEFDADPLVWCRGSF